MTQSLTAITTSELVKQLLAGEREFSNTKLATANALHDDSGFEELVAYLKGQDLRGAPIKADHSDWRGIRANGLFFQSTQFAGTDLSGAEFKDADLRRCDMTGVNLAGSDLTAVAITHTRLQEANLSNAILRYADMYEAALAGTNLRGADLTFALVIRLSMKGADLTGATFTGTDLYRADLRGTVGLAETRDLGTARFYRSIVTSAEAGIVEAAMRARPLFDLRDE